MVVVCWRSAFWCVFAYCLVLAVPERAEATADMRISVTLESGKPLYLVGEPITLTVTAKNRTHNRIEAWKLLVERFEPEIEVFLSRDGKSFSQYLMGIFPVADAVRRIEVLEPRKARVYSLRVLFAVRSENALAFHEAGDYWIKVRYPLITPAPPTRTEFESNTIRVHVNEPQGVDAKVWEVIRAREFLYFLQCGLVRAGHENVPRKAVEILRKMPKSAYDDALRYALKEHYSRRRMHMNRPREEADPEMRELREVLGIVMEPEGPFPDDRRLDVKITYHFPEWTPREQVFEVISVAGGVPLRLAPELRLLQSKGIEVTETLRSFMHSYEDPCMWLPEPDGGYRLVPVKAPERTNVPKPPKQEGR